MSKPLPTSYTAKLYLVGRVYPDMPDEVMMMYLSWKPTDDGEYFLIEEFDLERSIYWAGVDPTQRQVAQLRKNIEAIRAEAQNRVTKTQSEINNLLQLTHSDIIDGVDK